MVRVYHRLFAWASGEESGKEKRMTVVGRKIRPSRSDFVRLRPTGAVGLITRPKKHAIVMFFYRAFEPHQSRITKKKTPVYDRRFLFGAADEARTRYLHLGKVALYQMSYSRIYLVPPGGIALLRQSHGG